MDRKTLETLFVELNGWSQIIQIDDKLRSAVECLHTLPVDLASAGEVSETVFVKTAVELHTYQCENGKRLLIGKCPSCAKVYWS